MELIYGVKMGDAYRLFTAHGPIIVEKQKYDTWGAGYYMADFIAERMYGGHLAVHQCAILAAYILFQAKEHVDGCGGDSHIAVLRQNGVSGLVDYRRVESLTKLLQFADFELGRIMLDAAKLELVDEVFQDRTRTSVDSLNAFRRVGRKDLEQDIERMGHLGEMLGAGPLGPRDSLGLPLQLDDQPMEEQE